MSDLFTLFGGGAPDVSKDATVDAPVDEKLAVLLSSPDRKSRVAAYAYVYANPDGGRTCDLVDAVTAEPTPFGQYWGVRALRRRVQADPTALDAATRQRLEHFATMLEPETDGADELRQLLGDRPA